MQSTGLTRKQALNRYGSALIYIQMRLASTGTLWRLLLEYPLEAGTVCAYVPAEFPIPQIPCFEEDCIVTSPEETQERKRWEAEFTSQFLLAAPNHVAVYYWPTRGQITPGEQIPQVGKLYRYQETSVQDTRQGANTLSLVENYLILPAEEGSIERVLRAQESIPDRRFCCALASVDSSILKSPERALDDAALRQIAASVQHLLVSAFDHYARLLWTRQHDAAWIPQLDLNDEIRRSPAGNSMCVELNPAPTLDYLYQRLCNTVWRRWIGSERLPTRERVLLCCPQSSKRVQVKFFTTSFRNFAHETTASAGEDARKQAYEFIRSQLANAPGASVLISGRTFDSPVVRNDRRDFVLLTTAQLIDGRTINLRTMLHCVGASELSRERFEALFPPGSPPVRSCCVLLRETENVSQLRSKAEICWDDVDDVLVPATLYLCAGVFHGEFPLFVPPPVRG